MPEQLDFIKTISLDGKIMDRVRSRIIFAYSHLLGSLSDTYGGAGLPGALASYTVSMASSEKHTMDEIERIVHLALVEEGAFKNFDEKMDVRALMWYQKIAPYIVGRKFLDLGGGDGRTAKRVQDEQKIKGQDIEVHVADVLDYPDRVRGLPYTRMGRRRTPFADREFDTVFLGTVFHHVGSELDDHLELMDESIRVARRRVIVIESIYQTPEEKLYTMWIDWWYNRILHFDEDPVKKVNVPFNFREPEDWKARLEERGLKVSDYDLGTFQILNPEHHWLFVVEK